MTGLRPRCLLSLVVAMGALPIGVAHAKEPCAKEKKFEESCRKPANKSIASYCVRFGAVYSYVGCMARESRATVDKVLKQAPCLGRTDMQKGKQCSEKIEMKYQQAFNAIQSEYPPRAGNPNFVYNRGPKGGGYRICFVGDTGNNGPGQREVAKAMGARDEMNKRVCDEIRHLGDIVYYVGIDGIDEKKRPEEARMLRETFSQHYDGLEVPMYMVLGNHDYYLNPDLWLTISRDSKLAPSAANQGYDVPHKYEFPNHYYLDVLAPPGEKGLCMLALDTTPLATPNQEKSGSDEDDGQTDPAKKAEKKKQKEKELYAPMSEARDDQLALECRDKDATIKKDEEGKKKAMEAVYRDQLQKLQMGPRTSKRADAQRFWLETLEKDKVFKERCTRIISLSHHPYNNVSLDRDETLSARLVQDLYQTTLFHNLGIDMVVAGHDHFLAWMPKMNACHKTLEKPDRKGGIDMADNYVCMAKDNVDIADVPEIVSGAGGMLNDSALVDPDLPDDHKVFRRNGFVQMELLTSSQNPSLEAKITYHVFDQTPRDGKGPCPIARREKPLVVTWKAKPRPTTK